MQIGDGCSPRRVKLQKQSFLWFGCGVRKAGSIYLTQSTYIFELPL